MKMRTKRTKNMIAVLRYIGIFAVCLGYCMMFFYACLRAIEMGMIG